MKAKIDKKESQVRLAACHARLGIGPELLEQALRGESQQPLCQEATSLEDVGCDVFGRPQRLAPAAAQAWRRLVAAAEAAGVSLQLVSAYRGFEYQTDLIARKLATGQALDDILKVSAAPGFSEHHGGCAVDVTTEGAPALEVDFERTACFRWLSQHAGELGFVLSYPQGNPFGIAYEPWHWCFRGAAMA